MEVARQIVYDRRRRPRIRRGTVELLNRWCNQYGLLGLLHHETVVAQIETASGRKVFYPRNGVWDAASGYADEDESVMTSSIAVVRGEKAHSIYPLHKAWGPYFPDIADDESASYPHPITSDFWKSYGEPLSKIVRAAERLENAIETLSTEKGNLRAFEVLSLIEKPSTATEGDGLLPDGFPSLDVRLPSSFDFDAPQPEEALEWDRHSHILEAFRDLEWLLQGTTPSISINAQGEYALRLQGPSLLSTLALMAIDDVLLGRAHIMRCKSEPCGRYFRSVKPNAAYCSARCRKREQMRTFRARKKQEKEEGTGSVE